jgi:hypothetical protein
MQGNLSEHGESRQNLQRQGGDANRTNLSIGKNHLSLLAADIASVFFYRSSPAAVNLIEQRQRCRRADFFSSRD